MNLSWGTSVKNFQKHVKDTKKFTEKKVTRLVEATAKEMLNIVKYETPVKTGRLRRNWHLVSTGTGSKRKFILSNNLDYASYVEHGTSKQAPKRMLAKSIIKGRNSMKRRLEVLKKQMEHEFNRG